jgi:short-subunit dehydrogenase involved in D-alanine esterification of teichoic acids
MISIMNTLTNLLIGFSKGIRLKLINKYMADDNTLFLLGKAISDIQNLKEELTHIQRSNKDDIKNVINSIESIEKLLSKIENRHVKLGGIIIGAISVFSFLAYLISKVPLIKPLKEFL